MTIKSVGNPNPTFNLFDRWLLEASGAGANSPLAHPNTSALGALTVPSFGSSFGGPTPQSAQHARHALLNGVNAGTMRQQSPQGLTPQAVMMQQYMLQTAMMMGAMQALLQQQMMMMMVLQMLPQLLQALQNMLSSSPEGLREQDFGVGASSKGRNNFRRGNFADASTGTAEPPTGASAPLPSSGAVGPRNASFPSSGISQPPKKTGVSGKVGDAYRDYRNKIGQGLQLDGNARGQLDQVTNKVNENRQVIDEIARKADLPFEMVAAIWYRESSFDKTTYLHNGEKLGRPTTLVPRGIYFGEHQFVDAAVHALKQKSSTANALGLHYGSKDYAAMAAFTERYNGFGYRNRGTESAYVLAGTNAYQGGMYVADGRFDPNARDRRLGTLAIMLALGNPG